MILKIRKAFSLTELMVSIFILVVILVMGAAFANFSSGKLQSAKTVKVNEAVRNTFDIISQKMNGANARGTGAATGIFGFKLLPSNIIGVVNKGTTTTCSFFGLDAGKIKMISNDCSTLPASISTGQAVTPDSITVTTFNVTGNYMSGPIPSEIPKITLEIVAEEKNNPSNNIKLQNTYFLDYQTVKQIAI